MDEKESKQKKTVKKTTKGYIEAIGRRKTAIARVRLTEDSKASFIVNEKDIKEYFPVREMQATALSPLKQSGLQGKYSVSAKANGGGIAAQAEAIRLGISRVLVSIDAELKKPLKKSGFLKRNPRMKERRKFGLKKARKAPQWSKR